MIATALLAAGAGDGPLSVLAPFMGVFFVAFFVSIVATPIVRWLAVRNGIVDLPDLQRKNHLLPVAYLGGLAIFLGWLAGILGSYWLAPDAVEIGLFERRAMQFPLSVIIGAGVIVITGLMDDVYDIPARVKIGGQFFAAAALTWQNVGINLTVKMFSLIGLAPGDTAIYIVATAVVVCFVVGGCNSVNLLDGLDGLAAGVVAIAMVAFLAIALLAGRDSEAVSLLNPTWIVLCLATLGAVLGFLPYNFQPATVFMGDAGSLLLGFLAVSVILLFGEARGVNFKLVTAALIVFAVPITDSFLAVVRRKLRGQPISAPDRQHLHHLLINAGFSVRRAVLMLYTLAIAFALLGVLLVAFELQWRYLLAVFFVLYGSVTVTAFKYGAYCLAIEQQRLEAEKAMPVIPDSAPINLPGFSLPDRGGDPDDSGVELPRFEQDQR